MSGRLRRYRWWLVGGLVSLMLAGGWRAMAASQQEAPQRDLQLHQRLDRALANEGKMQEVLGAIQEELRIIKLRVSAKRAGSS